MTQSSAALDISDDEGKSKSFDGTVETADRGKENIDPNETFASSAPVTRSTATVTTTVDRAEGTKEDSRSGEPRTPLGDLNATEFYGVGLDATSVVLVHDDIPQELVQADLPAEIEDEQLALPATTPNNDDFTFEVQQEPGSKAQIEVPVEEIPDWARTTSLALASDTQQDEQPVQNTEPVDIDIWESESAKDENEQYDEVQQHHVVVGAGQTISLSGGCLQEL